jgi:hypothetical protein
MSALGGLPVVGARVTERARMARLVPSCVASRATAARPAEKEAISASPVEATRQAAARYPAANLAVVAVVFPVVATRILADALATLALPPAPVSGRGAR